MFLQYENFRAGAGLLVSEHGGQSAAARTLGVTQSAIAQALSGARPMIDLLTRIYVEIGGADRVTPVYYVSGLQIEHLLTVM